MIRLRKHDRKMIKVAAVLVSCIAVVIGLIWIDMQRGLHGGGGSSAPNQHNNLFRSNHEAGPDASRGEGLFTAEYIHGRNSDRLFYPDSSGSAASGSSSGSDFAADASDFAPSASDSQSGSSIPEPSTLGIAAIGMVALLNRRRAMRLLAA